MPNFVSKALPIHFPTLTDNFDTFTEEAMARECDIPGGPWRQVWASNDTITLYFLDTNALFAPTIRIRDVNSNETFTIFGIQVNFPHYYFTIPTSFYAGRTIVVELGVNAAGGFSLLHTSAEQDIYNSGDPRIACTYLATYWGCSDDYGIQWLDDENTAVPSLPMTIRMKDSIRRSTEVYTRTVSENAAKRYEVCASEIDFLKMLRIEFAPNYWIEKLGIITSMRNLLIDGVRYVQEAAPQTGQQLRNLPLFKAEILLRLGEQDNLYKFGCC